MQELVLHGHLGDDRLHAPALLVGLGFLPGFERLSASGKEGVAPLGEGGGGDAILSARGLQIGATKQLQNDTRFALGRPPALAAAAGFRLARRSPSGLPLRARKPKHSRWTYLTPSIANQCPTKSCCGRAQDRRPNSPRHQHRRTAPDRSPRGNVRTPGEVRLCPGMGPQALRQGLQAAGGIALHGSRRGTSVSVA